MKITKKNPFTGQIRSFEINITKEELKRIERGELIQNVVPHLSADDREFMISGITGEEYDQMFEEENDLQRHRDIDPYDEQAF